MGPTDFWSGGAMPYQVQNAANLAGASWKNLGGPLTKNVLETRTDFVIWVAAELMLRFTEEAH